MFYRIDNSMKRDMDLIWRILLKVEDDYDCANLINLKIDGYSAKAIAYNSQLAFEAGYLSNCSVQYADNGVWTFSVGSLTWEGHDCLDRIRDDSRWGKIKKAARDRGLPLVAESVGTISSAIITAAAEDATNSFLKQNGLH